MSGLRGDQASLGPASGCGRAVPPTRQLMEEEEGGHAPVGSGRLQERRWEHPAGSRAWDG